MRRAVLLRRVANHVASVAPEFSRAVFAKPLGVEMHDGHPCLVMEFIEGEPPKDTRLFQQTLEAVLLRSGLPTWSITRRNPKAFEDIVVNQEGKLIALDYESVLPPLFVSAEERRLMRERKAFFPIDAIDWRRLEVTLLFALQARYPQYEDFATCMKALRELGRHT